MAADVVFCVTGFGKFYGVPDNPTMHLIRNLQQRGYLPAATAAGSSSGPAPLSSTLRLSKVLEVSAVGSMFDFEESYHAMLLHEGVTAHQHEVWIHFGVDSGADGFHMERFGWNEAHFTCPDERGWEPQHQPIDPSRPSGSSLQTTLPISFLSLRLGEPFRPTITTDPGRFLCNWRYYCSLRKALSFPAGRQPHVLFVHVPSFGVHDAERQLSFAQHLCREIVAYFTVEEQVRRTFEALLTGRPPALIESWWHRLAAHFRHFPRAYHNVVHVAHLIDLTEQHLPAALSRTKVLWCCFFHDAIYDPLSSHNEENSAELWMEFVQAIEPPEITPAAAAEVRDWILATKHHLQTTPAAESELAYFLDFDLAILGSEPARYEEYAAAIRHEYQHVSEADFCSKRAQILRGFLEHPFLYFTPRFRDLLGERAILNLRHEIEQLDQRTAALQKKAQIKTTSRGLTSLFRHH
jgi:predicted metal-dependent HD superfamily phosphohydrolase